MKTVIVDPPAITPVTLAEAKDSIKDDLGLEDALITGYIKAATDLVEKRMNRAIITQTRRKVFNCFDSQLYVEPMQAVTSVQYLDPDTRVLTTLDSDEYHADLDQGVIDPISCWPATADLSGAVHITYEAGFGDATTNVPESIRQAILLLVGSFYNNREAESAIELKEIPFGVKALIDPYRVWT